MSKSNEGRDAQLLVPRPGSRAGPACYACPISAGAALIIVVGPAPWPSQTRSRCGWSITSSTRWSTSSSAPARPRRAAHRGGRGPLRVRAQMDDGRHPHQRQSTSPGRRRPPEIVSCCGHCRVRHLVGYAGVTIRWSRAATCPRCQHRPQLTVWLITSTSGGVAGQAACSRSLCGWVRVLSPSERTRPRVRSLDTPVTEDPLPHSVTGAAPASVSPS